MINSLFNSLREYGIKKTCVRVIAAAHYKFFIYIYIPYAKLFKVQHVKSYYGPLFRCNFSDLTFNFYIRASYGFYFSKFLLNLEKSFIFLDIGANQGLYSLIAARNDYCKEVLAFEPVSATYKLLCKNIDINNLSEKIVRINVAISDIEADRLINLTPSHSGVASLIHGTERGESESIKCISVISLSKLMTTTRNHPIVVKIDTEGHEPVVVEQLRLSAFWSAIEYLYFEVDLRWFDGEALISSLIADGFVEQNRSSNGEHFDVMLRRTAANYPSGTQGLSTCLEL